MKARKRYRQRIRVPGLLLLVVIIAAVAIITGCMRKTETDARTSSANLTTAEALRTEQEKESRYQAALEMMEKEEYKKALDAFRALGDYQNAASLYENCCEQYKIVAYDEAIQLITGRQYSQALSILSSIEELDSDYEGVSVLSNYCNNCKLLENINNVLDKGYAKQALDILKVFPDCTERAEAYYRLKDLVAMNIKEAISITKNKAVFDERYPKGSLWIIEGSFQHIYGNNGSYCLHLYTSENTDIGCYDIDADQLKEVRDDDYFVICGEFIYYDYHIDDSYSFYFDNCRILSEASNSKLSGVFKSDQSLSRVTGAEECLRQYIEKAENNNESKTKESDLENGQQNTNTETENDTKLIELRYYSLDLPFDWMEKVYVSVYEADKSINFNEKKNYDADYGGFLSYICLMLETEEEEYGYEHTVLGTLTSPNGNISYYVVADLPGDVPYDYDNSSLKTAYLSAQEGLEAVYASIKGINGWKYVPGKKPNKTATDKLTERSDIQLFEVPYYSVEIPCEYSDQLNVDLDEVGNSMWFDLKANDDSGKTYYLFGLIIIYSDRDFSALDQVHPMHDILGDLTTDHGEELYLVAVYPRPNSLYFEDEDMWEQYGEFTNKIIPQILGSIKGVNGCTYLAWEDNR